jgi:hypothetical protein
VDEKKHDAKEVRRTCDVLGCGSLARHIDLRTNLKLCEFCWNRCERLRFACGSQAGFDKFILETYLKPDAMMTMPEVYIVAER